MVGEWGKKGVGGDGYVDSNRVKIKVDTHTLIWHSIERGGGCIGRVGRERVGGREWAGGGIPEHVRRLCHGCLLVLCSGGISWERQGGGR